MDDIDDLLDEVEKDLEITNKCGNKKPKKGSKQTKPTEFDDDVDSILKEDFNFMKTTKSQEKESSLKSSNSRCSVLYIGGSNDKPGLNTSLNRCPCSYLRCTACDFKVEQYDNFEWNKSVDYLFFRNNMPDYNKVNMKLIKRQGSRAYACQCCWKSVKTMNKVQSFDELKWVCGKH